MADSLSLSASIAGVAGAGTKIALELITLAEAIATSPRRIRRIADDVSVTCAVLDQLKSLMQEKDGGNGNQSNIFNKQALQDVEAAVTRCDEIFGDINSELEKARKQLGARAMPQGSVRLSRLERANWPFLQPSIDVLRTDLREGKDTLLLMLTVATLAHAEKLALRGKTVFDPQERQKLTSTVVTLNMAINAHDRTRATGGLVTENGSVINSHKDKPSHLNDLASSNRNSMNEEARNQERALTEPRQELQVRPVSLPAAKREISPQDVANGDVFQYQVQDLQSSQSIHQAFQNLRAPRSPDRSPSPGPEAPHDTSKGGKESEQINPGPEIFQTPETERNNPMDTAGTENYDMAASARNAAPTKADRGVDNLTERVEALSEAQGDEDELLAFTNTILEPSRDVVASGVKRLRVPIAEIKARLERQLKECISVIDTLNSLNAQQRNLIVEHTSAINADLAAVEKLPPVRKSTVLGDIEVTMLMWIARRDAQDIKRGREKSARELLEKEQFHAERVHRERLERERAERERLEKRIGEEVERRLAKSGVQNNQSEGTDDPSKVEKYRRPTYPRCNKKYLAKETLEHYGLPYEVDKDDPEFFLILKDISELEMDSLFEHTRLLRERADSVGRKAREKLGIEEGRPRPLSLSRIEEGDERPAADPLAPKAKQGSEQQATTQVDSGIKDERTSKSLLGRLKSLGRRDSKKESPSPSPLAIATQRPSSMPNMWPSTIPSTIDAVPLTKRSDEGEAEVDEDGDGAESDGALDMPMVAGGEELVKELMDKWTTLGVNGETAEEKGREDKNDI